MLELYFQPRLTALSEPLKHLVLTHDGLKRFEAPAS
jgi:hypothetical protein